MDTSLRSVSTGPTSFNTIDSTGKVVGSYNNQNGVLVNTTPGLPTIPAPTTAGPTKTQPVITAGPAISNNNTVSNGITQSTTAIQNQAATKASAAIPSNSTTTNTPTPNFGFDSGQAPTGETRQVNGSNGGLYTVDSNGGIVAGPNNGQYQVGQNISQYPDLYQRVTGQTLGDSGSSTDFQSSTNNYVSNLDKAYNDLHTTLTGIQNGTVPLNPAQQAIIDNMKRQAQAAHDAQVTANANYNGGVTTLQNTLGTSRYAPDMAMGAIKSAIDQGVTKLGDLDAKAASAIAQATQSFQDGNYKNAFDAYTQYSQYLNQRQAALTTMHNDVVKAAADAQNYQLDLAKFNEAVANDQFSNDLATKKQAQDEKNTLFDQNIKLEGLAIDKANLAIKQKQADAANLIPTGDPTSTTPVTLNDNGSVNTDQQNAYLSQFPAMTQAIVKSILNYQQMPPTLTSGSAEALAAKAQILGIAHMADPTFDSGVYADRQKTMQNFTSGKYSQNINSLNTAVNHIGTLATTLKDFNNSDLTGYNSVSNYLSSKFGSGKVTSVSTELSAISTEMAAALKQNGATDTEIEKFQKGLDVNSSPAQFKAAISTLSTLLGGRLNALSETYSAGTSGITGIGKPPPEGLILHPTAKNVLTQLKNAGFDVNVPGIQFTDPKSFIKSSPQNAQALKDTASLLQQADPSRTFTPEEVLQYYNATTPEDTSSYTAPEDLGQSKGPSFTFGSSNNSLNNTLNFSNFMNSLSTK